jgi:hypothetical protein
LFGDAPQRVPPLRLNKAARDQCFDFLGQRTLLCGRK